AKDLHGLSYDDLREKLYEDMVHAYEVREQHIGTEDMREFERQVLLHNIDTKWIDYLHNIDLLRDGIQLRSYAQKDPLQEYKREAFNMFNQLLRAVQAESIQHIFRAQPQMMEVNDMFEIPEEMLRPENLPEGMTQDDFFAMLQGLMEQQLRGENGEEDQETTAQRQYLMEQMQAAEAEHQAYLAQQAGAEGGAEGASDAAGEKPLDPEMTQPPGTAGDAIPVIDLKTQTPKISESRPAKNGKGSKPKKDSAQSVNGKNGNGAEAKEGSDDESKPSEAVSDSGSGDVS
ncbi:MAG: hypothetical protein JSS86_13175, partial [Cyanobacteria bacterium SZAS LIN-2]|nr:hypothetical protein [Cyanobacteria bacterium SZAS LIN-2]